MKPRLFYIGLLLLIGAYCSQPPEMHFAGRPVILISLDTTRADHLSCYGYGHKTSQNIDSLAKDGILFKNAISQVPLTFPSHSSVFTGKYPFHLRVKDNGGYILDDSHTTLAEVLLKHGYITAGVIGAFVLHSKWGISQGFQEYDDNVEYEAYKTFSLISIDRPANVVSEKAIEWINGKSNKQSFFLFVHFFDPHAPYFSHKDLGDQLPMNYDEEIAFMDMHIGQLVQYLKEKDLYDESIIIIFGDHGEDLGEHGEKAHGIFLYDSVLRVPLIVKLPGNIRKGAVIAQQVQLVDIMPTILDLVEVRHSLALDGMSLNNHLMGNEQKDLSKHYPGKKGERFAYSETYYPYLHYGWSPLFSARTNEYKYIKAPKPEFYNMKKDMLERRNWLDKEKGEAAEYRSYLEKVAQNLGDIAKPAEISSEEREKLMALGYAGFSPEDISEGERADPKAKIDLLKALDDGKEFSDKNDMQNALAKLNYVVQKDAGIIEAWFVLGNSYAKIQRYDEAIQAFSYVVKLNPMNSYGLFNLAHAYQKKGNWREAVVWYKKAIAADGKFFKALVSAGELLYFLGEYDEALYYLQKALALKDNIAGIFNYLAGINYFKGNIDEAKNYALKAYELDRELPFLHYHLALIYEKEHSEDKALDAYKKELEINPKNYSALHNSGLLYARRQNYVEAEKIFRSLIDLRPDDWRPYFLLANVLVRQKGANKESEALMKKSRQLKENSSSPRTKESSF